MKIEFVKNDPEETTLDSLKPGDWFLFKDSPALNSPSVYCLLENPIIVRSAKCFNASDSVVINIWVRQKVIPVETTLQVTKKPVRPVGTGCF